MGIWVMMQHGQSQGPFLESWPEKSKLSAENQIRRQAKGILWRVMKIR
jgi:hypothetical protein